MELRENNRTGANINNEINKKIIKRSRLLNMNGNSNVQKLL